MIYKKEDLRKRNLVLFLLRRGKTASLLMIHSHFTGFPQFPLFFTLLSRYCRSSAQTLWRMCGCGVCCSGTCWHLLAVHFLPCTDHVEFLRGSLYTPCGFDTCGACADFSQTRNCPFFRMHCCVYFTIGNNITLYRLCATLYFQCALKNNTILHPDSGFDHCPPISQNYILYPIISPSLFFC